MRISFFNQNNNSTKIHIDGKKITPSVKVFAKTKAELIQHFSKAESRAVKARISKCTDKGEGHWAYLGYKDGSDSIKHVVVFMTESRSHSMVSFRNGREVQEVECEINQSSTDKGVLVWNVYSDREIVGLNETQLLNSFATSDATSEDKDAIIADLRRQLAEVTRQRDEITVIANEEKRKRKVHVIRGVKTRNKLHCANKIIKQNGLSTASEVSEELKNFEFENDSVVEEPKQETSVVNTETEVEKTPYEKLECEINSLELKRSVAQTPEEGVLLASIIKQKKIKLNSTSKYCWAA